MIIVNVIGGLGNQMFQYAMGKALAVKNNTELYLDISSFKNYELHQGFELQRLFDTKFITSTKKDILKILSWQSIPLFKRLLLKSFMSFFRRNAFVVEPHFQYWENIKLVKDKSYLLGYWQSEKYFSNVFQLIRTDFEFKLPLNSTNAALALQISQSNSVSLHVRRGDYASNPKATAVHGLCSIDYYQAAIQYIHENTDNPEFYIFSDDIDWAKKNLIISHTHHYIENNYASESYNDMHLMSLCQHNIIANSSFSWWGAWLNKNPTKIVIAPKRWFQNNNDTTDLIPNNWIRI